MFQIIKKKNGKKMVYLIEFNKMNIHIPIKNTKNEKEEKRDEKRKENMNNTEINVQSSNINKFK